MQVINQVQIYRKQRNLTQGELAELVGVSRRTIGSLEKGHYTPSLLLAFQLAKVLHVELAAIFQLEED